MILVALLAAEAPGGSRALLVAGVLVGTPAASLLFHHVWKAVLPAYRTWATRSGEITHEIARLRARVTAIFDGYRERGKGEAFKKAYGLAGKSVSELEEALAVGMYRERREVMVVHYTIAVLGVVYVLGGGGGRVDSRARQGHSPAVETCLAPRVAPGDGGAVATAAEAIIRMTQ